MKSCHHASKFYASTVALHNPLLCATRKGRGQPAKRSPRLHQSRSFPSFALVTKHARVCRQKFQKVQACYFEDERSDIESALQASRCYLDDAKQLQSQGETLFKGGDIRQSRDVFKHAHQKLLLAKPACLIKGPLRREAKPLVSPLSDTELLRNVSLGALATVSNAVQQIGVLLLTGLAVTAGLAIATTSQQVVSDFVTSLPYTTWLFWYVTIFVGFPISSAIILESVVQMNNYEAMSLAISSMYEWGLDNLEESNVNDLQLLFFVLVFQVESEIDEHDVYGTWLHQAGRLMRSLDR